MLPSPEKLHALGTVTFRWNLAENQLGVLFREVTGLSIELSWIITKDMGDVTIGNKIKEAMKLSKLTKDQVLAVEHCLALYDINRENRNQLTHFTIEAEQGEYVLARKSKTSIKPQSFPNTLGDLRRVADELHQLSWYISMVCCHLMTRANAAPWSLPDKPPLPGKLWKPPPPTQSERKRQPRS